MSSQLSILQNRVNEQDERITELKHQVALLLREPDQSERIEKLEMRLRQSTVDLTAIVADACETSAETACMLRRRIGEQDKRIEKLEVALRDVTRCQCRLWSRSPLSELGHSSISEHAIALIVRYGGTDGAHHKQWVLDQVLRLLAGEAYEEIIAQARQDDHSWSEGIPP